MSKSYKAQKEEFVSNLSGGSITEINLVTAVAPAAYILFAAFQSRIQFFRPKFGVPALLIDFFINVCGLLLSMTLYSSFPVLLILLFIFPAAILHLVPRIKLKHKPRKTNNLETNLPKKAFITVYRGFMMVITCISILAVDFKIFPRRFAKAENWGTSLMDLGVGSFVFSSGIVAARSALKGSARQGFMARMEAAGRTAAPLILLGFIRLAMVKGVEYAEHTTEYGVHWNFFFTLACLPPFVAALQSFSPRGSVWSGAVVSLLVGVAYQMMLDSTGLKEYVLVGDRRKYGFVGMNKEGLSSFFGYLAIFLAGQATGFYILPREVSAKGGKVLKMLVGWSVGWTVLFMLVNHPWAASVDVSRRLANLPYFLWVAAFNTVQLTAFYVIEWVFFSRREGSGGYEFAVPRVLEAFNRNGLAVFLVANLLTGLVNVSINTLEVGRVGALVILVAYTGVLTAIAVGLDYKDLSIKL
ncbi:Glucosaminyl phosphatidylinositol (GlcN-PI) nositol acylation protein [Rhizina undulata]